MPRPVSSPPRSPPRFSEVNSLMSLSPGSHLKVANKRAKHGDLCVSVSDLVALPLFMHVVVVAVLYTSISNGSTI